MSLESGNYRVYAFPQGFRLSWYEGKYVRVNDSSNVLLEINKVTSGYQLRYNNQGSKSDWFGADDNLTDDSKVLLKGDSKFVWSITQAGHGLYKVGIYNKDAVWSVSAEPQNADAVKLGKAQGAATELWKFERA